MPGHLLNPLQNIETAAAAIAFQRIRRVGNLLQFPQDEMRNHENAVQKTRLADIGNPAVNDDARIENLVGLLRRTLAAENSAKSRKIQQIAFVRTNDQSDVRH